MIKRIGVLFLLIISMFYLVGCEFFPSDVKEEIIIDKIEVDESTILNEYVIGEVDLSEIKLIIYTSDGKKKNIVLSEDYINSLDLEKLNVIGTHNISIEYEGKKIDLTITIKEKHVHTESKWIIENEATCELDGLKYKECVDCKERLNEVVMAAYTHSYKKEVLEVTCLTDGYSIFTCVRCNDEYIDNNIKALGHNLTKHNELEPTCLEIGYKAYEECSRCSYTTYEEIKALGHNLTKHNELEPTCLEIGYKAYEECSRCSYTTYEEIKALGHSYSLKWDIDIYPTESSVGFKSHHYLNYGCISRIDKNEIPMLPYTDGLNYTLSSSKNAHIVTDIGECKEAYVNITTTYNGLPVTSIGSSAFEGCTSLTSITIPFVGATLYGTSNAHFGYIFGTSSSTYNDDYVQNQ